MIGDCFNALISGDRVLARSAQIDVPFLWFQRPLVKSGNRAEALPDATDASLSGPGTLQEAAS
jgi:hypothetical protein